MTLKITEIPVDLLIQIFRKVNGRTLCRLRQTCKFLDGIVETNRFYINAHLSSTNLRVRLQTTGSGVHPSVAVTNRNVDWVKLYHVPISSLIEITDPIKQLSGVSFQTIVVHLDELLWGHPLDCFSVRLLEDIRMNCRILCFLNAPEICISLCLPLFKYENLWIEGLTNCPKTVNWNGCKKLFLKDVSKENILHLMPFFEEASVEFDGSGWDKLDAALRTVNDFIETQITFPEQGKLKKCFVIIWTPLITLIGRRECTSAALTHLYSRQPPGVYMNYYKARITGGEMLIIEKQHFRLQTTFEIHLCAGSIRETLFEELFPGAKKCLLEMYDNFMEAATHEEALQQFDHIYEAYLEMPMKNFVVFD